MKHVALVLIALVAVTVRVASASPRYFGDPAMIIRPNHLMQRLAASSDGQPRLLRAGNKAGLDGQPDPVPEPSSAVLLPLGSAAVLWARRRRPASRSTPQRVDCQTAR